MMMSARTAASAAAALMMGCVAFEAARADHRPVIVVPGNPQVPVIINGVPADGALVTGDWGLYAPDRVVPEVYPPVGGLYAPVLLTPERGYFPRTGKRPRYGRQEVEAPRYLPPPAPSFYREWSTSPEHAPATEYPSYRYPSYDPPPVIRAPEYRSYDRPRGGR